MFDDEALAKRAQVLLEGIAGPGASLRADQALAIAAVVEQRRRALLVQATGWGKSAVYFVAAKLLLERGAGPALVISPLLALMRDQIDAAARAGISAVTINSANVAEWEDTIEAVTTGRVDVLLVSPERLANAEFVTRVLRPLRPGLLVIDEAHCISDWGHDFRPHYRRIGALIQSLGDVPVLAATATANERVVADVVEQLGDHVLTLRGGLDRAGLSLAVVDLGSNPSRLAWLAGALARHHGQIGIIYALTQHDAEAAAAWLAAEGYSTAAYHGGLPAELRLELEGDLRCGRLDALVATSALGMGFDARDIRFVYHLGLPPTPVAYYQAIGRAGRSGVGAEVVALPGDDDGRVWDWMSSVAMPAAQLCHAVLGVLSTDRPRSVPAIEAAVDIKRSRLDMLLNVLDVDGAVAKVSGGWIRTGTPWSFDWERYERVSAAREGEATAILSYLSGEACRLVFLRAHLDDPTLRAGEVCGRCDICDPQSWEERRRAPSEVVQARAARVLATRTVEVEPRRAWPAAAGLPAPFKGRISPAAQPTRALSRQGDGFSGVVDAYLRTADPELGEQLVAGLTRTLRQLGWPAGRPTEVCWIPSRRGEASEHLARRLAAVGALDLVDLVTHADPERPRQTQFSNSAHLAGNAIAAFTLKASPRAGQPVLVVDDVARSGWTIAVVAHLLHTAGASAVYPVVLSVTS